MSTVAASTTGQPDPLLPLIPLDAQDLAAAADDLKPDSANEPQQQQKQQQQQQQQQQKQQQQQQKPSQPEPAFLHSPPDSNNADKSEASDSELSDLDEEPVLEDAPALHPPPLQPSLPPSASSSLPPPNDVEDAIDVEDERKDTDEAEADIGEILPADWSGNVPIFRPTMAQFKDFKLFMQKVDSYGMKSGVIKIIPPAEWKDAQPPLDDLIKQVRVREPIKQDIMGFNGTYRQVNFLHGRSFNVPQWRQLCEQSEHQPPARRGERRANADRAKLQRARPAAPKSAPKSATPKTRGRGRPPKTRGKQKKEDETRPMTPVSPKPDAQEPAEEAVPSVENDKDNDNDNDQHQDAEESDAPPTFRRMGAVRSAKPTTQSTSARRKYGHREGSAVVDEIAFKDFDYRMDISDYTPDRCEELERVYWKTLTYAPPLYGADLMGTLFDDRTETWNLNKLPNLLDVLGTKVPGVNTAYLYLGMWKATFAWHLEDVDLYSINYLHFGAPKQWYSISQADARRFEAAMKSIWPADAKACDQFLRHKAFLISPQHLLQNFGIKVNKVVSYPGEFVVTYPYGYHSGYNLGYNCAEAVNFALESWLDMGKIAKKCECAQAQDSVWINVYEIERKLRGEDTEYEETEDEDESDEDEDDEDEPSGLPTPPASHGVKFKGAGSKRKRSLGDGRGTKAKLKKIKLRLKIKAEPPCCLCPNDIPGLELVPTNNGQMAHRLCALYIPETYIDVVDGKEVVSNVTGIHKDRLELKCLFCRSKRGACFQCSQKKCARSYHATCAAAAGVFIEDQDVPVFGEDGTEYKEQAFEFSCRFHRTKRDKKVDWTSLEDDPRILAAAQALKQGDICQMQYVKGDIFAGLVVENRASEQTLLIDVLPNCERLEVEWKWLLLPNPADLHLPKASANAIPLPTSRTAKDQLNAKRQHDDRPRKDDTFVEGGFTWAEFNTLDTVNKDQVKVDLSKEDQIWYYLGRTSTEARAQFTEDVGKPRFNPKGNFLDTLPKPPKPAPAPRAPRYQAHYGPPGPSPGPQVYANAGYGGVPQQHQGSAAYHQQQQQQQQQPYLYHPRQPSNVTYHGMPVSTPQPYTPSYLSAPAPPPPLPRQPQTFSMPPGYQAQAVHPNASSYSPHQVYQPHPSSVLAPPLAAPPAAAFQAAPQFAPPPLEHPMGPPMASPMAMASRYPAAPPAAPLAPSPVPSPAPPSASLQANVEQASPQMGSGFPAQTAAQASAAPVQPPQPPHSKLTWQVHSSIFQKYPFYQVNHNRHVALDAMRDSSKYRTPYAPWGGFTNGYQGDLRAHLMQNQQDLLRRPSLGSGHHPVTQLPQPTCTQSTQHEASVPQGSPSALQTPLSSQAPLQPKPSLLSPANPAGSPNHQNLPAIKAQYRNLIKQNTPTHQTAESPSLSSKPKATANAPVPVPVPVPAAKPYKVGLPAAVSLSLKSTRSATQIPVKQSPVPLPANFLAAMTSSPNTLASSFSSPPPLNPPSLQTSPIKKTISPVVKGSPQIMPIAGAGGTHSSTPGQVTSGALASRTQKPVAPATVSNTLLAGRSDYAPGGVSTSATQQHQEFPDVPGCESMEFVERMLGNLRRASQRSGAD